MKSQQQANPHQIDTIEYREFQERMERDAKGLPNPKNRPQSRSGPLQEPVETDEFGTVTKWATMPCNCTLFERGQEYRARLIREWVSIVRIRPPGAGAEVLVPEWRFQAQLQYEVPRQGFVDHLETGAIPARTPMALMNPLKKTYARDDGKGPATWLWTADPMPTLWQIAPTSAELLSKDYKPCDKSPILWVREMTEAERNYAWVHMYEMPPEEPPAKPALRVIGEIPAHLAGKVSGRRNFGA